MNISLTPHLEEMVKQKVDSGKYNSASEVMREALRLLEEQDRLRVVRYEELRKDIQEGIAELESGKGIEIDEEYFEDIKASGRNKLAKNKKRE